MTFIGKHSTCYQYFSGKRGNILYGVKNRDGRIMHTTLGWSKQKCLRSIAERLGVREWWLHSYGDLLVVAERKGYKIVPVEIKEIRSKETK